MELKMKFRALVLTACAVAALSACQRREEAPPPVVEAQPKAEVTPADQAAPLNYERRTEYASVELKLPPSIAAHPDLHATLYGEGVADLRRFVEGAQGDQTEYTGERDLPTYERTLDWEAGGETAKLTSLSQTAFEFTGGAHPNTVYGAVLWDRALDRRIQPADLFRGNADMGVLDRALCEAVNAARTQRLNAPSALRVAASEADWPACPRAAETPFVLEPSRTQGKAGGLVFFISPYVVGPYAEGTYRVVVPQAAFRALLAPAYAGEFAGEPVRTGEVSPAA